jgi:adhesin transport system outer membrane protein
MNVKMGRVTLMGIAVFGATLLSYQPAYSQTLSEVVDQTIKSNPDVLIDATHRLSLDHVVDQARGGYNPKIDLALGIGREWNENTSTRPGSDTFTRRESSLTLSQMLYDGYRVKSEVDRSQSRVESAAHRVASTSERIGLRAVEVYLEVLRRQELVALTQDNLAAHEKTLEQIKLRADSGVGRKADLEQAQARLALSQANLVAAQANLREAQIAFQRVAGSAPGELDKPDDFSCELLPSKLDDAVSLAFANHPAIRSAIAEHEVQLALKQGAEANMRPRVDLEMGTGFNHNLDGVDYRNNEAYAMLRLRHNVYNGGSDKARIAETHYLSEEAKEVIQRTKRELEESTRLSWNALETAKDRLPKLKAHSEATEATRDAYAKQFNIGQRTLLDLLDAENELFTARTDYVNGQYQERFANYRLMADLGKLLDTLGVEHREEAKTADSSQ